jgi:hypothetical protein
MTNTNQTSSIKIDPKCQSDIREYAYSATGWILPCCYADNDSIDDFKDIMSDQLKVENVNNVNDIFSSEQWGEFFNRLHQDPDCAPRACKYYCGKRWDTKSFTGI